MLLNSINYFVFLSLVFILNYSLPSRFRWMLLLVASIFFYMMAGPALIIVPAIITVTTYFCGIFLEQAPGKRDKKLYFYVGLAINLGLLIFFKYINFFIENILRGVYLLKHVFNSGEIKHTPIVLQIIVPLGISYITFQAIGYLIEIRRGNHSAEKNLGLFATYIMFFPKLLSGPIERAHNFLPQLHERKEFNYEQVAGGLKRILWGLFLKLVVASRLAVYTDADLSHPYFKYHSGIALLIGSVFYTLQLYADFVGYTDMAIGSAQILGYKMMENFNKPFIAKSISEFWRRWHISLTTWVNEYIYNPIAINRRGWGRWGVVYAVIVTFLLLGFWHGAKWTFIIFGLLQGIILSGEIFTTKIRKRLRAKIPVWFNNILSWTYTFGFYTFSLIFFRANNAGDAVTIVKEIVTAHKGTSIDAHSYILAALIVVMDGWIYPRYDGQIAFFNNKNSWMRKLSYSLVIITILLLGVFDGGQFIYFKF